MQRAEALYTALEHEAMHQETLLYMWHRLPYRAEERASGEATQISRESRSSGRITNAAFASRPASRRSGPIAIALPSAGTTSSASIA